MLGVDLEAPAPRIGEPHIRTATNLLRSSHVSLRAGYCPDNVVIVAELPRTVTGTLMNNRLREMFREHTSPNR